MPDLESVNERIVQLAEHFGVNKASEFSKRTGLSHQNSSNYLKGNKRPSIEALRKIKLSFDSVDMNWLVNGKGQMELSNPNDVNIQQNFDLKTDLKLTQQQIPLYDIEAVAGLVPLFDNPNGAATGEYISIPKVPKCDGAVFVTGDSMYPLLKSGDIIAYKRINDYKNEIFWGEMYLVSIEVSGEEYISVKYVQKSEEGKEYIKLVSENRHHQPKDIHLSKVRAMAMIKASVRINSMG